MYGNNSTDYHRGDINRRAGHDSHEGEALKAFQNFREFESKH
jgi:hypothetical protein